jgi:hypothetical protein
MAEFQLSESRCLPCEGYRDLPIPIPGRTIFNLNGTREKEVMEICLNREGGLPSVPAVRSGIPGLSVLLIQMFLPAGTA